MRWSLYPVLTGRRAGKAHSALTLFTALTIGLMALFAASSAQAACTVTSGGGTGNAPATGATVVCTGTDTGGVFNGSADNVTVTVDAGAVLSNNSANAIIFLRDGNSVSNNGTITGGLDAFGIFVSSNNNLGTGTGISNSGTITVGDVGFGIFAAGTSNFVSNGGTISGGNSSVGIFATDSNTVVNSGLVALGDNAFGLDVGSNNVVTNSGLIIVGQGGVGIQAVNNNNTSTGITNSGTISVGNFSWGIQVGDNNIVTNSGTITAGDNAYGISGGATNTVTNTGNITVGTKSNGISVDNGSTGSAITNNGSISAGVGGTGMYTGGNHGSVENNGTIVVGSSISGFAASGIKVNGSNNAITNTGTIIVGASVTGAAAAGINTTGIAFNDTLNNSGTIRAGANGYTMLTSGEANSFINSGTLDGKLSVGGVSNTLANSGLITITDPGTPVGYSHDVVSGFTQTSTGILALRVTPSTAPGSYDSLHVFDAGAFGLNLGGTLRATIQPGLYANTTTYASVASTTFGVRTGAFDQVTSSSPFFSGATVANGNSVDLTLTRVAFNAVGGLNKNQAAVGTALEGAYSTMLTGNAAALYGNLLATTGSPAAIYTQLSGEGVTAAQDSAFFAGSMFNSIIMDQATGWPGSGGAVSSSDSALGYAPESQGSPAFKAVKAPYAPVERSGWRAWFAAFGGKQSMKGDTTTGSADATQNIAGGVVGIERYVDAGLSYGFALGASDTHFNVSDLATSGSATAGHFGVYGVKNWSSLYFAGTLNYARVNNKTTRNVTALGISETEEGTFSSNQFGGRFESGYKMRFGSFGVTPFAAMQFSYLMQPGYSETSSGAGLFALTYGSQTVTSLPAFLGAQVDTRYTFGNGMALMPFARLSWVHEFKPTRQVTASFNAVPASGFTVDGARAASDAARLDAGAKLAISERWSAFASLGGEFSTRSSNYSASGGIRYAW